MSNELQTITNEAGDDTGLIAEGPVFKPMTQAEFDERAALLDEIDEMDEDEAVEVSSKYWEAETPGEKRKGIFAGMKVLTKPDDTTGEMKNIPAVVLDTKEHGVLLLGGVTVVDTFLTSVPENSPVLVTYNGKKGRAKMFGVKILTRKSSAK